MAAPPSAGAAQLTDSESRLAMLTVGVAGAAGLVEGLAVTVDDQAP